MKDSQDEAPLRALFSELAASDRKAAPPFEETCRDMRPLSISLWRRAAPLVLAAGLLIAACVGIAFLAQGGNTAGKQNQVVQVEALDPILDWPEEWQLPTAFLLNMDSEPTDPGVLPGTPDPSPATTMNRQL